MLHMLPLTLLACLSLTTSAWAAPACSVKVSSTSSASAAASSATGSVQTTGSGASSNTTTGPDGPLAIAWYAGWLADTSKVSWSKYTHVMFSFGIPRSPTNVTFGESGGEEALSDFVTTAKQNNVKALLTLGGWTGSLNFSSIVSTKENRAQFIDTLTGLVTQYDLDGLDFDWEYPSKTGVGCNQNSPQDTPNFLQFLTELRATDVMKNKVMSAAAALTPFQGEDGTPSKDVSGFAKVLNHLSIMNYDVYGRWSSDQGVGPNAPLDDTCGVPGSLGSATSSVKSWTDAGFPANQLVLGVPSYGHSYHVPNTAAIVSDGTPSSNSSLEALPQGDFAIAAYPAFDPQQQPMGQKPDAGGEKDVCGVVDPLPSGQWTFSGMIGEWLDESGTPLSGIGFRYDDCSQTPYVYNKDSQIMVSYDDPTSFAAKGKFIASKGLAGFAMWEASSDHNDLLVDSIRSASGM